MAIELVTRMDQLANNQAKPYEDQSLFGNEVESAQSLFGYEMDESIEMEITMEVGQKASIKQSFHQA